MKEPSGDPCPEKNASSAADSKKCFRSEDLFQGSREVLILHGEAQYRLQITKAGKLILIK